MAVGQSLHRFREEFVAGIPVLQPGHPLYRWLVLSSVMIGTFMAVLDATIVNVALPKMAPIFGVTLDTVEWVLTAYLLIFAVMLPSSGWLSDRFGTKRMFIVGLFLFTLGSLLSSLAWEIHVLIAFRVIQGSGAGFLLPVGMAILTREFPPEQRGIAMGFWSVAASASVSLGPTLGGYLIDHYSWHTIFDVNVPIGLAGMVVAAVILREQKSEVRSPFDLLGFCSMSIGLTALLLALATANSNWNTGGWTSTYILSCFAVSAVSLLIFAITELSVAHPLIRLRLFRYRNFGMANLVLFIFGVGMFGTNFLLPVFLQDSLDYTPFQAGLVFLPVGLLLGVTAPLGGIVSDKYSAKLPAFIGLVLMAYSLYEYYFLSLYSDHSQIMWPLYVRGVAIGLIMAPLTTIGISEIANRDMAQASGLINVVRQLGGSFGIAIFGTLLTRRTIFHATRYGEQLDRYSGAFQQTMAHLQWHVSRTSGDSFAGAQQQAGVLLEMHVQNQAFVQAIDDLFLVAAVVVVASILPVLLLRRVKSGSGRPTVMD